MLPRVVAGRIPTSSQNLRPGLLGRGADLLPTGAFVHAGSSFGHSVATADRVVDDGNVGSHAFKYGPWAGPELDGRLQLYYSPIQHDDKGRLRSVAGYRRRW